MINIYVKIALYIKLVCLGWQPGRQITKKELLVHSITADSPIFFSSMIHLLTLFILHFLLTDPIYTKINNIDIHTYKCMYTK